MLVIETQHAPHPQVRSLLRRRPFRLFLLLAYGLAAMFVGAKAYKDGYLSDYVMPYVRAAWTWPVNSIRALSAEPLRIGIDIKWEDYQQLAYQRKVALEATTLFSENQTFVPARFKLEHDEFPVKLRLKGDGVNHLMGDKWSFRVRTTGQNSFLGMVQFSLHDPSVRNWMFEWLGHRMMAREDIIALRYDLADVTLNGKRLGIYAIEEHFEKRLIEHNRRREGPLVRFNEDLMWHEITDQTRPFMGSETSGIGDYEVSEPEGFSSGRVMSNPVMRDLYLKSVGMLDAFRRGRLTTGQVFDVPLLARYFALVDLLGAEHGSRWHNIRFYFNPVTLKLEPVSFDLFGGQPTKALTISGISTTSAHDPLATHEAEFHRQLFSDHEFAARYLAELERVSRPAYLAESLKAVDTELQDALAVLYTEFPYYEFDPAVLERNQRYIRSILNPNRGVQARLRSLEGGELRLAVANITYLPVSIEAVESANGAVYRAVEPTVLNPRPFRSPVDFVERTFLGPEIDSADGSKDPPAYTILYRPAGTAAMQRAEVTPYSLPDPSVWTSDVQRQAGNLERFEFLEVEAAAKTIRIRPGKWTVSQDLVIPPGYTVRAGAGTELDLVKAAIFFSRSPLTWIGAEEAPIVVRSSDGTGQGMVVLQAGAMSELEHVHFEGLVNPERPGWKLTGAVTFYESPLTARSCVFRKNVSEDSLNTIRGSLRMERCAFVDTLRDAFDGDFCDVSMVATDFVNIGNDGFDVSGSTVLLENVTVDGAKDKGLSIGEHSRGVARGVAVRRARIGLASKDLSEFQIDGASLESCAYGPTVLQKKPEFGGGTLHVRRLSMTDVGQSYLVEEGSVLTVDGQPIASTTKDAKVIVYGTDSPFPIAKFSH